MFESSCQFNDKAGVNFGSIVVFNTYSVHRYLLHENFKRAAGIKYHFVVSDVSQTEAEKVIHKFSITLTVILCGQYLTCLSADEFESFLEKVSEFWFLAILSKAKLDGVNERPY